MYWKCYRIYWDILISNFHFFMLTFTRKQKACIKNDYGLILIILSYTLRCENKIAFKIAMVCRLLKHMNGILTEFMNYLSRISGISVLILTDICDMFVKNVHVGVVCGRHQWLFTKIILAFNFIARLPKI